MQIPALGQWHNDFIENNVFDWDPLLPCTLCMGFKGAGVQGFLPDSQTSSHNQKSTKELAPTQKQQALITVN